MSTLFIYLFKFWSFYSLLVMFTITGTNTHLVHAVDTAHVHGIYIYIYTYIHTNV